MGRKKKDDSPTLVVSELIAHLQTLPQDAPVKIWDAEGNVDITKRHVYLTKKRNVLFHYSPKEAAEQPSDFFAVPVEVMT